MGFFSKKECFVCNEKVGLFSRKKLNDKNYICKNCEKMCSAYIEVSNFDSDFILKHIEYMKKQNILYEKEVESLDEKDKLRFVSGSDGIVFIDSIGMFEIISSKYNKNSLKELFRYDQVQDFNYYTKGHTSDEGRHIEAGIEIIFRCPINTKGLKNNYIPLGMQHPYVSKIRIPFENGTSDVMCGRLVKEHLNKLYGRASDTLLGNIERNFIGTGKQRAQVKAGFESLKAFGNLAKSVIQNDSEGIQNATNDLTNATKDAADATYNYGAKYTKIADEAEKRAWNS